MTRDELLKAAFEKQFTDWFIQPDDTLKEIRWWWFLAGANAAMDLQFEPGAVRFGEPRVETYPAVLDLGGES